MRCDWVFRWWIHWCERFGQICERTGSACYLIHAVSPVGHVLNIAGQVVTALSLWPHAYHPSIWRGGGVEQMNRGPRWGGSAHTHTHSHTTLTPPILCLNVYWNIHTSSYGAAARTAREMLGGVVEVWCWNVMTAYVVFIETLRAFLDSAELCNFIYVLLKKPIFSILLFFNSKKCELLHNSLKSILNNGIPLNIVPI